MPAAGIWALHCGHPQDRRVDCRHGQLTASHRRLQLIQHGGHLIGTETSRPSRHELRHTAASLAVSAHANSKAVQRMLGHAKASITLDIYADLFDEDLDGVADRLDAAIQATADVLRTASKS